ncbi:MAG: hypothetical protein VW312_06595, partial [Opitutales bacterium]
LLQLGCLIRKKGYFVRSHPTFCCLVGLPGKELSFFSDLETKEFFYLERRIYFLCHFINKLLN